MDLCSFGIVRFLATTDVSSIHITMAKQLKQDSVTVEMLVSVEL